MIPAYVLLLRARNLMDRCYAEPLDVPRLAAEACCSEAHFIRSFKRAFGETPHRYLTRRRVERAKHLLRESDQTVTDVCFAVGFASLGSFSATFAELVGEPPSAYRNRWRAVPSAIPACATMMWTRPYGSSSFGEASPRASS